MNGDNGFHGDGSTRQDLELCPIGNGNLIGLRGNKKISASFSLSQRIR
jgi:hypothetical protein